MRKNTEYMAKVDIRRERAARKRRICRDLKRIGMTKKELSDRTGMHYNTVKRYLNPDIPGWSPVLVELSEQIISEAENATA